MDSLLYNKTKFTEFLKDLFNDPFEKHYVKVVMDSDEELIIESYSDNGTVVIELFGETGNSTDISLDSFLILLKLFKSLKPKENGTCKHFFKNDYIININDCWSDIEIEFLINEEMFIIRSFDKNDKFINREPVCFETYFIHDTFNLLKICSELFNFNFKEFNKKFEEHYQFKF